MQIPVVIAALCIGLVYAIMVGDKDLTMRLGMAMIAVPTVMSVGIPWWVTVLLIIALIIYFLISHNKLETVINLNKEDDRLQEDKVMRVYQSIGCTGTILHKNPYNNQFIIGVGDEEFKAVLASNEDPARVEIKDAIVTLAVDSKKRLVFRRLVTKDENPRVFDPPKYVPAIPVPRDTNEDSVIAVNSELDMLFDRVIEGEYEEVDN